MSEKSLYINPAAAMAAGAGVGLIGGYVFAPRKYSLKRLLVQQPDTFEKLFPKEVKDTMLKKELAALRDIQHASDEFHASGASDQNAVRHAAIKWRQKYSAVKIDEELLANAARKKEAIREASETGADIKGLAYEYKRALKEIRRAKFEAMRKLPDRGYEVKMAYKEMQKALANKHTKTSNKLFELINKDNLKESYNSIKKFLPKARAQSAAAGAVALGTLTTLVTIFFNPSTQNN